VLAKGGSTLGQAGQLRGGEQVASPRFTCCSPEIQKLADYSDVISEVPILIQIFRAPPGTPLPGLPSSLADGDGARCPLPRTPPRSRPFEPRFYGSQGPTHFTELATLLMIDFKCRPI